MIKIAVIGLAGKWSTETLADAIEEKTGFRLIVDMSQVVFDLKSQSLCYKNHDLCQLDGLIVKKSVRFIAPTRWIDWNFCALTNRQGSRFLVAQKMFCV